MNENEIFYLFNLKSAKQIIIELKVRRDGLHLFRVNESIFHL